jgi:hypothetical protein
MTAALGSAAGVEFEDAVAAGVEPVIDAGVACAEAASLAGAADDGCPGTSAALAVSAACPQAIPETSKTVRNPRILTPEATRRPNP